MAGTLGSTGSEMSFGRINRAFTNNLPGAAGNAPAGGQNIRLSAVLGSNPGTYNGVNYGVGVQISLTIAFGGKTYPFTY